MDPFRKTGTSPLNHSKNTTTNPLFLGKPTIFDQPSKNPNDKRSNSIGEKNPWGGLSFPNQNNTNEQIQKQFKLRDNRIDFLESQVKLLTQTVTLCVKTINEMKNQNQTQYQTLKPVQQPPASLNPTTHSVFPFQPNPQTIFTQKLGKVIHKSENQIIFQDKQIYIYLQANVKPESAKDVKIENQFAKIIFRQNVNLQSIKANLSQWIEMNSSNVKIKVPELKGKKCDIFIKDFHQFTKCLTPQKQQEIYDQVSKAKEDPKFQTVEFDCTNGMLYTKCRGL